MHWAWFLLIFLALAAFLVLGPWLCGRMFLPGLTLALLRRGGKGLVRFLGRLKPGLEFKLLVEAGNRLFGRKFAAAPYQRRLLFLPFCLRPLGCPAEVHPETGLCCLGDCPACELGRLRQEALDLGYEQVYVVPSSKLMKGHGLLPSDQFIKAKLAQHAPLAALGVVCEWHLRQRLLPDTRVNRSGYQVSQGVKAALHGVLLEAKNCRQAQVNWDRVRRAMLLKAF